MQPFYLQHALHLIREEVESEIRSRVHTVYLGDETVLARVLGRFKMYLRCDDIGFAGHVMMDGFWESWLTRFLARICEPGMTVVDVGANFGYHSLTLGDICGPSGHLICVEPNPAALDLLRKTIALNGLAGHTRIEALALGEHPDEIVHLVVPKGEPKNAHVAAAAPDIDVNSIMVASTSLDRLLAERRRVDLIKIDAEGAEPAILRGGRTILRRDRPHMVLEYNAARYRDPGAVLAELLDIYGGVHRIDFEGNAVEIDPRAASGDRSGEDQLLYFKRP